MNKKEKELFLGLCRFIAPDEKKLRELIEEGSATPEVLGMIFSNRMAGVAYHTLTKLDLLGMTNREFRNSLRDIATVNRRSNRELVGCLNFLTAELDSCGVDYALLKGAYLCGLYPIGCRTSNDIDVLIASEDVGRVAARLKLAGFRQGYLKDWNFIPATREQIIESRMTRGETVPFVRDTRHPFIKYMEVDLNFSLDYKNGNSELLRDILSRSEKRETGETSVRTLSPCDFFLHLCAHLYKEATTMPWIKMGRDMTLYKYCDLYLLMENMSDRDISELIESAIKLGCARELAYSLKSAEALFGVSRESARSFLRNFPSERLDEVISPADGKIYRYTESDIQKRFFSKNRLSLLKEVSE